MSDSFVNEVLSPTGPMRAAKIQIPKAKGKVPANHPLVYKDIHDRLLIYLQQRLYAGKEARDKTLERMIQIDKHVAGWQKLSQADKDRAKETAKSGKALPTEMNLPLVFVHLDDMMTYFAQTFAPSQGMFYQTGKPDEQTSAKQIVTLMNNHAIYAGYFREVLQGLYSLLKYNRGGYKITWTKEEGPKLTKNPSTGEDVLETQVRWQGNKLEAIDAYNFLPDPSVHPNRLHCDGEFAGVAYTRSKYWLQRKCNQGVFYNCELALAQDQQVNSWEYYVNPPQQAQFDADDSGGTNWKAILTETSGSAGANYELVDLYINLNPTEWNLVPKSAATTRDRYELWKITILNNQYIIQAQYQNNIHGYLPYVMGLLNDDIMGTSQKSVAEILTPLQSFASSLLNAHVKANRKNLFGTTFYDPSMFDFSSIEDGDVAGRVKMKVTAQGRDIRTGIFKETGMLDTKQTMQDLDSIMTIVNQFFPTQSLPSQIANIDRAIDSQVAAVQQGANKRQQKAARLLDESLFRFVRFMMYYNIIQYQPDAEEVTDYYSNTSVKIDLNQLRNTDLPFIIGQGLKAIDRQAAAKAMQSLIFALIQAPNAAQGIDILKMIDFWSSMIDVEIDMTQFRLQQAAPAEGAPAIDPATGQPIQAAVNPNAVTAPMSGRAA